ncbi:MAG: Hpt domain-containing protein [Phycisphaerales bacterium]
MSELVGFFVEELPARLEALRSAWTGGKTTLLARLAHQLKGAGSGYGFPQIGEAAARVEAALAGTSASSPPDLAAVNKQLRDLVDLCTRASANR